MWDIWQEIWGTIRKNKLRTFLTGFSVAWGIFMLIILLAAGNGLKNGVKSQFSWRAKNSLMMWPGRTSIPYNGLPKNRAIKFRPGDPEYLKGQHEQIKYILPVIEHRGDTLSVGKEYTYSSMVGVTPDFPKSRNVEVKSGNGRFINEADILQARKVVVIHDRTAEVLFRHVSPLGKYVKVNNILFQVVGIYSDDNMNQSPYTYAPLSTIQIIYHPEWSYDSFDMLIDGVNSVKDNEILERKIRESLGRIKDFSPDDNNAVYIWNILTNYLQTQGIFNGISLFIWIIGIGTLIAGVVGVSNIMLITVKERTHELGIRKALGARPSSILKLVVTESIVITLFFGYIGMIAGIGITELAASYLSISGGHMGRSIFMNPTVELPIAVSATAVLIVAGVLAGYFPARKAVKIKPIEALRNE